MSSDLSGDIVFDTSALLELLDLTPSGTMIKDLLASNSLEGHLSEVSLSEASYVLCRRLGYEHATSKIRALVASGYFEIKQTADILELASKYKCERSLSIVDCFALALGKELELPVLFSKREKELEKEIKIKPFDVRIFFLEDWIRINKAQSRLKRLKEQRISDPSQ